MTRDEKIFDICVPMIRRHSMDLAEWRFTRVGDLYPALCGKFCAISGELVMVSGCLSPEDWYVFTTRRIVCRFEGQLRENDPAKLVGSTFGNFKGLSATSRSLAAVSAEVALLTFVEGDELRFRFETGKASMGPIYATRYWQQKHPILDKLLTSAERKQFNRQ